ncbi:MAG TPA: MEDS domain-containing protein [Bryobacteraceae bacterium]|nr:MEDS domain-containing protein [Bryobacteraceae bacterium]
MRCTGKHEVQLYHDNPRTLAESVSPFLMEGLIAGNGVLVVATPQHSSAFLQELARLGADTATAVGEGRLLVLDAVKTLSRFNFGGGPHFDLFDSEIGTTLRDLATRFPGPVYAYGEMVGVLWAEGSFTTAMTVEEYWNKLLTTVHCHLLCAYPIDVFGRAFHPCDVDALLCNHTRFRPAARNEDLESAVHRALGDVLGTRAEHVKLQLNEEASPAWADTLKAESLILWIRQNLRERADEVLGRAHQYYYAASSK